jgi:hypothetical protein
MSLWHSWLITLELDELHHQSVAGASSSEWACQVLKTVAWREAEIIRLRNDSRILRLVRAWKGK